MKRYKLLIIFALAILGSCNDPNNKPALTEINTRVNSIAIDKDNVKWIATNEYLYKSVDGGFEKVELKSTGKINYLFYEENENQLWIGMDDKLIKADISDNGLTEQEIDNENLSNPKVNALHIDAGLIRWFGTNKGISLNHGDTWKKDSFSINALNDISALDVEKFSINSIASWDGDYYFATNGHKLYRTYDYNDSVDAFSGATQWEFPYNGRCLTDTMFVVFVDKAGSQWMGGKEGIQVHSGHDPKNPGALIYYHDELPDTYILAINQAPDGNIWVGTRKGLAVFNGTTWQTITQDLPDLNITSIAFDKDGSAWVGTKAGLVNLKSRV